MALANGFIPVVYGDVVMDSKQGISIASTEEVLRFISTVMPPSKVVLATDVNGIYDKDPNKYHDAKLIEIVNGSNIGQIIAGAGGAGKVDVTGGMKTKISILYEIVSGSDCVGHIVNANVVGAIKGVLLGDKNIMHTEVSKK
jgi:isopentenyl phosphate kinase